MLRVCLRQKVQKLFDLSEMNFGALVANLHGDFLVRFDEFEMIIFLLFR